MLEARCPHPSVIMWFCQTPTIPRPREGKAIVRVTSLFSHLLHHFPRTEFSALVKKHGAEVRTKEFLCWTQFMAMLSCHLARANSLREICQGLSCCLGKLSHLGAARPHKGPRCPTPTSTGPLPCSEPCSSKPWSASVLKAPWVERRARSNSRTGF
ncbi:hypothetical protein DFAR_2690018 [Desulfarculales bacterium]